MGGSLTSAAMSAQIQAAMKSGDKLRLETLRLLSAALKNAAVAKIGELSDEEAITIVASQVRRREEAAKAFADGGYTDRAATERLEADILREWLPVQLSIEELGPLVDEAIATSGATSPAQMGLVMKALMPRIAGRAEGKSVSDLVRAKLTLLLP